MDKENGSDAPSELEQKIIRQIEYYFGDFNLSRDKFLQEEIKKDDGWVPLETMVKFNRLKALSDDFAVIIGALEKSTSGLMEVSEDKTKIRRDPNQALPEETKERRDEVNTRSIYAKGFPLDSSLDAILGFFQDSWKTDNVQMRRDKKKAFKGSVFATFHSEDDAKKFMEQEEIKFGDSTIEKLWKVDYWNKKREEAKASREENLKRKLENKEKRQQEENEKFLERITKGAILKVSSLPGESKFGEIKEFFMKFGKVAWVDHDQGSSEAKVRFEGENGAKVAWEKAKTENDDKVMYKDSEIQAVVLEGEEELKHWRETFAAQKESKHGGQGGGRGGRRGGRGRGGRGRGHHRQGHGKRKTFDSDEEGSEEEPDEEPVAKQAKVEEGASAAKTQSESGESSQQADKCGEEPPTKKVKEDD